MYSDAATSALEAPVPIAVATSSSRSVSVASRWAAARWRSDASTSPKCVSRVRVTDGEMMASPEATTRTALMISSGGVSFTRKPLAPGSQGAQYLRVGLERGQHDDLRRLGQMPHGRGRGDAIHLG